MRALFLASEGTVPNIRQHYTAVGYGADTIELLDDLNQLLEAITTKKRKSKKTRKQEIKNEIDRLLDELHDFT